MTPALPLALALAALAAGAAEEAPSAKPDAGPRPALTTVSGTLAALAYGERRFTVATEQGPAALSFDRNTAVYLPHRMGTARDLAPGQVVRVAHGADGRAYWVEVHGGEEAVPPVAAAPAATAPPLVLAPREAAASAAGAPDGGAPPGRGGEVPAGPGQPEPNPGSRASPPPPPAPTRPSPLPPAAPR